MYKTLDEKLNTSGSAGSGTTFYFDYQDGSYGFNTSPSRGADTFNPFNQGSDVTKLYHSDTMNTNTTTIPISGSSAYDYLIVEVVGISSSYGELHQFITLDKQTYPFMWRFPISGGGRGLDISRSGDNIVAAYPSGAEGWGTKVLNVWGGNTITPPLGPVAYVDVINQCQLSQAISYTSTGLTFYGTIPFGNDYGYSKGTTFTWVDIEFLTGITATLQVQAASGYGTGFVYWDNVLKGSGAGTFNCNFTTSSVGHLKINVYNNNLSSGSCQLSGTIVPV